jgi:hypothetical protein
LTYFCQEEAAISGLCNGHGFREIQVLFLFFQKGRRRRCGNGAKGEEAKAQGRGMGEVLWT